MAIKVTTTFCVLAAALAIFFAFTANTEPMKETTNKAGDRRDCIFLVASLPVGDFVESSKDFEDFTKVSGHTKKEIVEGLNRCQILLFDRVEWDGKGWKFSLMEFPGNQTIPAWPKFLLEGHTVFALKDKKGGNITFAVDAIEMGGSTEFPRKRQVEVDIMMNRVNQGDPKNYDGVTCTTHRFDSRLLEYEPEGKFSLAPVKQEKQK